jgi:hypothetical protein
VETSQLPRYSRRRKMEGPVTPANNCVQATPSCAFCLFLCQGLGAPDAERWTSKVVPYARGHI